MRMSKKYFGLLFTLLAAFVLILAACGNNTDGDKNNNTNNKNNNNNSNNEEPNNTNNEDAASGDIYEFGSEELELTMFGNYDWYSMPAWGDDIASEWMKENKKINITSVDSGGEAQQKLSAMIVGNDFPDFIWTDKGADVEKLREAGKLVPLDDFIDKYPNLKQWLSEDAMNMLRSEDGKLYQFPNWYNSEPFGNAGYVVNKKIWTELGEPEINTPDDLYDFLVKVKENYPDVIPYETHVEAQGVDLLYSAFAEGHSPADKRIKAVPDGDKLTPLFSNDAYIESLQFANKLFREGLMTQDAYTQDLEQVEEKILNGKVAVYASASPTEFATDGHYRLLKDDPDAGYIMIHPIAKEGLDRSKIHPGSYEMLGWNVAVIPVNEEDPDRPEKVFAFLDWLTGPEGQSVQNFGVEGTYWDGFDDEGWPIFTEDYVNDPDGIGAIVNGSTNHQWVGNSNFLDTAKANFTMELPEEDRLWATHWQWEVTWPSQKDQTDYYALNPRAETPEGEILQHVNDIAEVAIATAVQNAQSEEEVKEIMLQAQADAEAVGYDELLEYLTGKWKENLEKLGW